MPKVSVIIPVYNVEKYLRQCLDSVVNQTLKDIEIICVNDGSTDESLAILEEFALKDERIKILNQENKGVSYARNTAMDSALGEFISFLDSDDFYPSNDILETLYNKAIENNVKICGGELAKFTNENPELKQNFGKNYAGMLFENDALIKYRDYQFDCGFYRFIYNRKFLIENKIYSPEYRRFEDPPFFVNAMILAKEFYGIHKITYAYRIRHKTVYWSEENTIGALLGIIDDFNYARKYKLNKLTEYTYARLKNHMKQFKDKKYPRKYLYILKIFLQEPYVRKEFIKNIIQGIFSIKNKKNHKIITLFWIKIKIRRKTD